MGAASRTLTAAASSKAAASSMAAASSPRVQEQSQQKRAGLTAIRDVQGDPSGRFKPLVVILMPIPMRER